MAEQRTTDADTTIRDLRMTNTSQRFLTLRGPGIFRRSFGAPGLQTRGPRVRRTLITVSSGSQVTPFGNVTS